ncbi:cytochrome P450 10 [Lingula anatina]|uniref:Cytochrome P450 10 n=1 Tax=Lingula anatina TaxID=7574 RepID=A0A1S3J8W9_LINAN|nr:cytochrome P450 10 [Lingula anatina]|eukprot:XP_013406758.1 cytochrome P450 10 [Lingula anatina]
MATVRRFQLARNLPKWLYSKKRKGAFDKTVKNASSTNLNASHQDLVSKCPFDKSQPSAGANTSTENSYMTSERVKYRPFHEIPGPKGLPIVGTLFDYIKKDGFGLNRLFKVQQTRSQEYGPIYREKLATVESIVISDPIEYSKVVRADGKYPQRTELLPIMHYRKQKGMGLGLVNSQGEEWHRQRSVIGKKLLVPKEVQQYIPSMNTVTDDFVQRLQQIRNHENGEVENMEHEMFKWALESIGTVLFENRIGCFEDVPLADAKDFIDHLLCFFKYMQTLVFGLPIYTIYPTKTYKQFEFHTDKVTAIGQKFVDKKVQSLNETSSFIKNEEEGEKLSFLSYLLSSKYLTPQEANSHVIDLMMGAVETTSTATIWTLYCLAINPNIQDNLYQELCKVFPTSTEITADKLQHLPYLKACLKEMFRLYPITFTTSRILQEDIEVCGYHIPKGKHVQANLYGMGHDAKLFEDPEKFNPERWLRDGAHASMGMKIFSNMRFGHGARMCIGRRIAEQEIYIALVKILKNFKLEYHHEPVEPVLNLVMTPDRPVKISFIPRTHLKTLDTE